MLTVNFLGKQFDNPLVLASGILGVSASSLKRVAENGCGAVTAKSVSIAPRTGHPNPTMVPYEHFFINAVGLSNPGVDKAVEELTNFKKICPGKHLIGSIFAGTPDEFGEVAGRLCAAPLDFLEIDISCPNVSKEFGTPFAYDKKAVETITKKVKANANVPVLVKLSPNAWDIDEIAVVAEAAGADAITAVNTVSGMVIDVHAKKPILSNKQGGVSGPALFPIALKCVFDIYKKIKIPILGTGGVNSGEDALAMIMAGATLVGVGSAAYFRGPNAWNLIAEEMKKIMSEEGIKSLDEIKGIAHK